MKPKRRVETESEPESKSEPKSEPELRSKRETEQTPIQPPEPKIGNRQNSKIEKSRVVKEQDVPKVNRKKQNSKKKTKDKDKSKRAKPKKTKSTSRKKVNKKRSRNKSRNRNGKATKKHTIHRPKGPSRHLINSLYGSSYSKMSSLQRKFIDRNLRRILIISQQTLNYLGYPKEAKMMGQYGTNIVEFWLYPNGDIKGLKLKRRIGASSLDRQTIEVIKTAYMNYPRPAVKTKIIIYVKYQLY